MMARVAALLVFLAMVILLILTFDMSGHNAILFSFVGFPLLGIGMILGVIALSRRLARERAAGTRRS